MARKRWLFRGSNYFSEHVIIFKKIIREHCMFVIVENVLSNIKLGNILMRLPMKKNHENLKKFSKSVNGLVSQHFTKAYRSKSKTTSTIYVRYFVDVLKS